LRCFLHHLVSVAKATARLAFLDAAAQAAMRLGGKVFQEQRVYRALKADTQL
jgi:hypothetical protein